MMKYISETVESFQKNIGFLIRYLWFRDVLDSANKIKSCENVFLTKILTNSLKFVIFNKFTHKVYLVLQVRIATGHIR